MSAAPHRQRRTVVIEVALRKRFGDGLPDVAMGWTLWPCPVCGSAFALSCVTLHVSDDGRVWCANGCSSPSVFAALDTQSPKERPRDVESPDVGLGAGDAGSSVSFTA